MGLVGEEEEEASVVVVEAGIGTGEREEAEEEGSIRRDRFVRFLSLLLSLLRSLNFNRRPRSVFRWPPTTLLHTYLLLLHLQLLEPRHTLRLLERLPLAIPIHLLRLVLDHRLQEINQRFLLHQNQGGTAIVETQDTRRSRTRVVGRRRSRRRTMEDGEQSLWSRGSRSRE